MGNELTEDNFRLALGRRAAAIAAHKAETRKRVSAETRLAIAEEALVNVWRWTNDGHPELELLLPILRAADANAALVRALDELEGAAS